MRKTLGPILILLGSFFLVLALLGRFYMFSHLLKTPLNVDSATYLSGTAALGNGPQFPVKVTSITRADSAKSGGSVVVFNNSTCVVKNIGNPPDCVPSSDPQNRLISASTDTFATNRRTALAVNDPKYVPSTAGEHQGLVNKFPFQTQKKDYPFWDATANRALTAKFSGMATINGLRAYVFKTSVAGAPIEIATGVKGTYSNNSTLYAEPLTGTILNQSQDQVRANSSGAPVLTLKAQYTRAQQAIEVKDTKANVNKLHLVHNVLPIVALVLGLLAMIAGILVLGRSDA